MYVSVDVVKHSSYLDHPELITLAVTYPRFIHAEVMTHRCLPADTELHFDLPAGSTRNEHRLYKMTIGEFHDKWLSGAAKRKPSRQRDLDLTLLDPNSLYTAKELSEILNISVSVIRLSCRTKRLVSQNLETKKRNEDFLILGSDFIEYRNTPKYYQQNHKPHLQAMKIRALDVDTGEVIHTNITDIWEVGDKELYELKADSFTIRGTHDHPVYTQRGWVNLCDVTSDDSVAVVSNRQSEHLDPNRFKKVEGAWRSTWQNKMRDKLSTMQENICSDCGVESDLEIHHIIPVHVDPSKCFDEDNIVAICRDCHNKAHEVQGWQPGNPLTASFVKVDFVVNTGEVETVYDLSVADKNHNFVANGIVVHNCFSRNASSSRAIPVNRMLDIISRKPAKPLYWGSNKPGMQAANELTGWRYHAANLLWSAAARTACTLSRLMGFVGLHKQHTNRITEPFQYITTLITATEWDNFFELRNHPDAQPEIQLLAMEMKRAIDESEPVELNQGEWHLPYIRYDEFGTVPFRMIQEASAARCARVSYLNHDGSQPNLQKDILLFKRLAGSKPLHASPLEHVAVPSWKNNANFVGWKQFRKTVESELL